MAEIWTLILPLCMWVTPPWRRWTAHAAAVKTETSLPPSSGRERERHFLRKQLMNWKIQEFRVLRRFKRVVFHEKLISISHDDVTNIQLCIYRDTPKSACLSAVPSHSQVPHPLCMCVCMCTRKRCHPSYLCKTLMGQHPPPFMGFW